MDQSSVGNGKAKRKVLSRAEARKLEDYVQGRWPVIEKLRPTLDELVKQATKDLGFEVSRHAIVGASKVMGKSLPGSRITSRKGSGSSMIMLAAVMKSFFIKMGEEDYANECDAIIDRIQGRQA